MLPLQRKYRWDKDVLKCIYRMDQTVKWGKHWKTSIDYEPLIWLSTDGADCSGTFFSLLFLFCAETMRSEGDTAHSESWKWHRKRCVWRNYVNTWYNSLWGVYLVWDKLTQHIRLQPWQPLTKAPAEGNVERGKQKLWKSAGSKFTGSSWVSPFGLAIVVPSGSLAISTIC